MVHGPVDGDGAGGTGGADRAPGLPTRIGGYAVERELGAGGMGTVYLARSRGGRPVAVKVARPELAGDAHFRERFRAEVAAARSVGGFHTAPVVDADPEAAAPWLATAYIPGPTLARLLESEGPRDEAALRQLGAALAEALAAIHRCGLVHRDLKPGNIIMAADGPRVLDFGIARALESTRLTATGTAFGTPGFLAPEQALGQEVDGAADVFALGAVLVAAAGGSAFGGGTPMGLMYRSVHEAPDLTAVPDGLRPVLAACLAKNPAERPTPARLLDLFVPDTALPQAPTVAVTLVTPVAPVVPAAPVAHVPPVSPVPPVAPVTPAHPTTPATPAHPTTPAHAAMPPAPAAPVFPAASYAPAVMAPPPPPYAPSQGFPPYQAPTAFAGAHVEEVSFTAVTAQRSVLIDAAGVAFGSDAGDLEFPWPAIAAVEHTVLGPREMTVTVRLHDGSVHQCFLAARRRSRLREWLADLPLVLEYYA
ncbi:serine/threonine-protein kinase [Streptomyces sp. NPDC048604]|uniref:serine/threonine-protein kinase n=1 Tax=Streptomyces sp. NPDC048604 TaxID=3365578 RepID=UPI003714F498